jgi:hypothetical protein
MNKAYTMGYKSINPNNGETLNTFEELGDAQL